MIFLDGLLGTFFFDFLVSSIFDMATTTNFHSLNWTPFDQAVEVGADGVRFQVASNLELTATSTWDFVGPDGTAGTYYNVPGENLSSVHDNDRYIRYKLYLHTDDSEYTPILSGLSMTFASECSPPGQIFFGGLEEGQYELIVTADGYQDYFNDVITIEESWDKIKVIMNPND